MLYAIKYFSKLNVIVLCGAVVTLALFYTMQYLILSDDTIPERLPPRIISKITMPEWKVDVVHETPRPEEIETPPELPDLEIREVVEGPTKLPSWTTLPTDVSEGIDGFGILGPADGNAMPIAQIQPVYPARALERGVEGFVILEFDVSETGTVINPEVLASEPAGYFDRAALRAIERWKYQPKIVNGKAVKMYGLQTRFSFNIKE